MTEKERCEGVALGLVYVPEDQAPPKWTGRRRRRRPKMLPEPAGYYDRTESIYPDRVRISFEDGHTEVYDRRVNQPGPVTYNNQPMRRRRKP